MITPRVIHRLLLAAALAGGFSSSLSRASMEDQPLPALIAQLQSMSANQREEKLRQIDEEFENATPPEREQKRRWLERQWAALSPEQRGQMHNQIREQWERKPAERRQEQRERPEAAQQSILPQRQEIERPARLSPDEREELHQWMRTQHPAGSGGRR